MSATERWCPRWTTSAPRACSRRRIMLMAASWPSKSEAADTKRSGGRAGCSMPGAAAGPPLRGAFTVYLLSGRISTHEYDRGWSGGSTRTAVAAVCRAARGQAHPSSVAIILRTPMNSRRTSPPQSGKSPAASPSPWRARRRDREVKSEAVIRTAARAFNRKGYLNTSLNDIATALEVTKPTVYYYVTNKEHLLFQCFLAGVEPIRA